MKRLTLHRIGTCAGTLLAVAALSACGLIDDNDDNDRAAVPARYTVTLTNLTANHPFAPIAAILHNGSYAAWEIGHPSSAGLEVLAECGNPADLNAEADADAAVIDTAPGLGVFGPGESSTVTLEGLIGGTPELDIAAMLVNANDAWAGVSGLALERAWGR